MAWQHTVFTVIAAELGEKGDRLGGALCDQFAVHPVHRVGESGPLASHFRREQVAYRDVESKPVGVEPVHQFVRPARARVVPVEGVAQQPQRVRVL